MLIITITRMGKYYRTNIPREIRRLLGLSVDDAVEWIYVDDRVV